MQVSFFYFNLKEVSKRNEQFVTYKGGFVVLKDRAVIDLFLYIYIVINRGC